MKLFYEVRGYLVWSLSVPVLVLCAHGLFSSFRSPAAPVVAVLLVLAAVGLVYVAVAALRRLQVTAALSAEEQSINHILGELVRLREGAASDAPKESSSEASIAESIRVREQLDLELNRIIRELKKSRRHRKAFHPHRASVRLISTLLYVMDSLHMYDRDESRDK